MIESGDSIECILRLDGSTLNLNPGKLGFLLAVDGPGTVTPALTNVCIETVTAVPSDGLMIAITGELAAGACNNS